MPKVQIRTVDGDVLLEERDMDTLPHIGEEVAVGSDVYHAAAPPSEVIDDEAIVYVARLPGEA